MHHPEYPGLEDFGDVMLRGNGGSGYIRVDWFTPDGLQHLGRRAPDHPRHRRLHRGPQERRHRRTAAAATTCSSSIRRRRATSTAADVALPYGERLVDDVLNRTETAMPQAHVFLAMELALKAEKQAVRVGTGGQSRAEAKG